VLAVGWFCEFGKGTDPSCTVVGVGCRKVSGCTLLCDVGREGCRDWKFGWGTIEAELASCAMGAVVLLWVRGVEFAEPAFGIALRLSEL
jgi:hypothetical protein